MTPLNPIAKQAALIITIKHLLGVINQERPVQTEQLRRAIREVEKALSRVEAARSDEAEKEQAGLFR